MSNYRVYNWTGRMRHLEPVYISVCLDGNNKLRERLLGFFGKFKSHETMTYLGHVIIRYGNVQRQNNWMVYALDFKPSGETFSGSDRAILLTERLESEAAAVAYIDKLMETALPFWEAVKRWPIIPMTAYLNRDEEKLLRGHPDGLRRVMRRVIELGMTELGLIPQTTPVDDIHEPPKRQKKPVVNK